MATSITERLDGIPTLAGSPTDLAAIENLGGAGVPERTGTNTWALRPVTGANSALSPETADALSLGTLSLPWGDLFLASGGVIDFNASDVKITHSANLLMVTGGDVSIGTSAVLTAGTIELGHATDTTLSRSAAGRLAVEGEDIPYSSEIRELLTANRTYHVDVTNGSDSNDGLSAGSGGAFATLQKAADVIFGTLDLGGFDVTVDVANGTHTSGLNISSPQVGDGTVTFDGDTTTPSNVVVSASGSAVKVTGYGVVVQVQGLKLQATTSGNCVEAAQGGRVKFTGQMELGAASGFTLYATLGGVIDSGSNNVTVSGGSNSLFKSQSLGIMFCQGGTWTLSGTPAFGQSIAAADAGAYLNIALISFSGGATGTRYVVNTSATIFTNGGGASFVPGNAAGTDNSGVGHYT